MVTQTITKNPKTFQTGGGKRVCMNQMSGQTEPYGGDPAFFLFSPLIHSSLL